MEQAEPGCGSGRGGEGGSGLGSATAGWGAHRGLVPAHRGCRAASLCTMLIISCAWRAMRHLPSPPSGLRQPPPPLLLSSPCRARPHDRLPRAPSLPQSLRFWRAMEASNSSCILDLEVVVEERCERYAAMLYPANAARNRALVNTKTGARRGREGRAVLCMRASGGGGSGPCIGLRAPGGGALQRLPTTSLPAWCSTRGSHH